MKMTPSQKRILATISETIEREEAETVITRVLQVKIGKFFETTQADPAFLTEFFARVEMVANASQARTIATHAMRPAEVAAKVADLKAQIEAEKAERKTPKESER